MGFVYLTSFGGVEKRLLLACARNVTEIFTLKTRISSLPFPPRLGFNPARAQYRAGALLSYLRRIDFPELVKLVAVVDFDLYEEGLNFVFGEAELGGRNAVVSTFRLGDLREEILFERVFKELNHELGHTFGLRHCRDALCVMSFSNSLEDVDRKRRLFCNLCYTQLRASVELHR